MKRSRYALTALAVVALSLAFVIGCKPVSSEVAPPAQSLTETQMDAIDAETTREWNADNPRARVTAVRVRGKLPSIDVVFENVNDWPMLEGLRLEAKQADGAQNTQSDAETAESGEESVDDESWVDWDYTEDYSASYTPAYSGDGFAQQGVRDHNGRTETWYSSNQLYHHSTSEWSVDDEGYYRTDEGYYVVAASDLPQGTVFETSKGDAIVLDSGCADGVTDFYTAF